jgi:calcium permeable stress-gated cation channel
MVDRFIEVSPKDIIWSNLGMNPYEKRVRKLISWAITAGIIILWAFPVAFVGAVSNISQLSETYPWLGWLTGLPPVVKGIIQVGNHWHFVILVKGLADDSL